MPDTIYTPFHELQARAGVPDIDEALEERSRLIAEWAGHAALYDNYGMFDAERKKRLAVAALQLRAAKDAAGLRYTQAQIDDEAHAHPAYVQFIEQAITGKAEWLVAKDRIDAITQRIQRANIMGRFAAAEPRV